MDILLKSTGAPIDEYSYEAVELLKDTAAQVGYAAPTNSATLAGAPTDSDSPQWRKRRTRPDAEIYAIDVSFAELKDKAERDYLNVQPTTFVLTAEAVDRLRAAAGKIIRTSPEFQRLLKDVGATVIADPHPAVQGSATR